MPVRQSRQLVLKKSQILFIALVLLFSGGLFADDDKEYSYVEGEGTSEIEKEEVAEEADPPPAQATINQQKLQEMIADFKKYNPDKADDFDKLQTGGLSPQEAQELLIKSMSKLPKNLSKKYTGGSGMPLGKNAEKAMSAGLDAFKSLPYDTALGHIKTKIDSSKAAWAFKKIPKSYELVTNFLRDDVAPKKFFAIVKDRKRLVIFGLCSISLIVVGAIVKRRRKAKNLPFGEAFSKGVTHFFFFTSLKIALIWFFFHPEITPLIKVFKQTYS